MKNNSVLITGAFGFIGSHLAEICVKKGYSVIAFDRYNSDNNFGWLDKSKYKSEMEFILGDIRDYDSVSKAVKKCDIIFHLAALIGIPYSYLSPLAYIRTNIEGTYNILESARSNNTEQTIITSTSETYGTAQFVPINEDHPLVGQSPYSASKIASDQLALSYYKSFETPIKIIRPFNTYGPRQSARAVIPSIISQLLQKKSSLSLGSLSPTRDLTYVTDTCNAFIEVSKIDSFYGEAVNVGNNKEISIADLVALISTIMELDVLVKKSSERIRPKESEVFRLVCDNEKLVSNSNWKPEVSLKLGLLNLIDWMKKPSNLNYFKSSIYNV
jgi:NAD dependent epimerase/dehydratase